METKRCKVARQTPGVESKGYLVPQVLTIEEAVCLWKRLTDILITDERERLQQMFASALWMTSGEEERERLEQAERERLGPAAEFPKERHNHGIIEQ